MIEPLKEVEMFLSEHPLDLENQELIMSRCFNETWFSDMLAWLLNPKGSHKLGVRFLNEFLKLIARKRCEGSQYSRKNTMLKWGKSGRGQSSSGLSLKNASVIREFYLAKSIKKRNGRGQRYCDIVVIDLDARDGLVLIIENKLFSSNHKYQLEEYFDIVEQKYQRTRIREYVYLTLNGNKPILYDGEDEKAYKNWVRLSWSCDILNVFRNLRYTEDNQEIKRFKALLEWLNKLNTIGTTILVDKLRSVFIDAAAKCLLEELERLGEGKKGEWSISKSNSNYVTLKHSSISRSLLYVELLPNFSITVQNRSKSQALYEKIIVPFGANVDQIYNLIDIAARDIYHYMINKQLYLARKRRLTVTLSETKKEIKPIFNFISLHHNELKIIMNSSKYVWEAHKSDEQENV